jgi:hypothetical protein
MYPLQYPGFSAIPARSRILSNKEDGTTPPPLRIRGRTALIRKEVSGLAITENRVARYAELWGVWGFL